MGILLITCLLCSFLMVIICLSHIIKEMLKESPEYIILILSIIFYVIFGFFFIIWFSEVIKTL